MFKKIIVHIQILVLITSISLLGFTTLTALAGNPLDVMDGNEDLDNDLLLASDEFKNGTDPNNADTDNDGLLDGWEVANGLNPLDPRDAWEDNDYELGEKLAHGKALQKDIDWRPNDNKWIWSNDNEIRVSHLNGDKRYDNYEEYYRPYWNKTISYDSGASGADVLIIQYMHTDPNNPDTDGDLNKCTYFEKYPGEGYAGGLDPDDRQPTKYNNDGTGPGAVTNEKNKPVAVAVNNNYQVGNDSLTIELKKEISDLDTTCPKLTNNLIDVKARLDFDALIFFRL